MGLEEIRKSHRHSSPITDAKRTPPKEAEPEAPKKEKKAKKSKKEEEPEEVPNVPEFDVDPELDSQE